MLPLMIIIGFAMMTLGVALLFLGEVPFIVGKRIPARRSRLIGAVLVSFLPLSWAVRTATNYYFPDEVEGVVVVALMFSFCCLVTFAILFRVLVPKREIRKSPATKQSPFAAAEPSPLETNDSAAESQPWAEPKPTQNLPAKKSSKPAVDNQDPFNFN